MQKLYNLNKWAELSDRSAMRFHNTRARVVRLDVNAPEAVRLYVHQDDDQDERFLARVIGRDVIEFVTSGAFELSSDGGEVSVYTVDGEDFSFKIIDPVVFTKLADRRKRSPELEYIAALMSKNLERRLAQQADEIRGLYERGEAARAAKPPNSDDAPDPRKAPKDADAGKSGGSKGAGGAGKTKAPGDESSDG